MKQPDVTLAEARQTLGDVLGTDRRLRYWSPGEIRWLAAQWRATMPTDDDIPVPPRRTSPDGTGHPVHAVVVEELASGLVWWLADSPRILRVVTSFVFLFVFGFGWGWFNG